MRGRVRALAGALIVALAACQADESTIPPPTDANVVGTYSLTIVNGGKLPFPYGSNASSRVDIVAGHITVTADHAFEDVLVFRQTYFAGGSEPDQVSKLTGTWTLAGSTLQMNYPGAPPQAAVVTGKLLSRNDQGLGLTYSK
jgi:hypothetical protein